MTRFQRTRSLHRTVNCDRLCNLFFAVLMCVSASEDTADFAFSRVKQKIKTKIPLSSAKLKKVGFLFYSSES